MTCPTGYNFDTVNKVCALAGTVTCGTTCKHIDNVYSFKYLSSDFLRDVCLPLCPLECNRTEYKTSVTTSQLIGDIYVEYIRRNKNLASDFIKRSINSDTVARSVVKINLFYESLSYTLVTESPKMNSVSLLASIGGNLGLFLGVSAFSLCEIVELVIRIYLIKN
jgi:predicted DNA-binding ribbon-helix-helix protein